MVGDQHHEGRRILDRGLQLLAIIDAGANVARRDPAFDATRFDERAQLVRLVAIFRAVTDEDVAGQAPLTVPAARL